MAGKLTLLSLTVLLLRSLSVWPSAGPAAQQPGSLPHQS